MSVTLRHDVGYYYYAEDSSLNLYEKLITKLNNYFIPKRNKHFCRYMFLKMRPQVEETTVAYATRLREKAHGCDLKTSEDERILEHLIQTIESQSLIQKCISKSWTLQEFLIEAGQMEALSEQVHDMKADPWSKKIANVAERSRNWRSRNSDTYERGHTTEPCIYCGLSGAHPRGRNCPAYGGGVQCETCKRFDHFSSVCRASTSPTDERYAHPKTHGQYQKKRVMKAEETYYSSDSSDEEFLTQSVGHLRVKNVRKSNGLNENQSIEIGNMQERVTQLEKEITAAKELIQNLIAQQQSHQYNPLMKMACKVLSFRNESGLQSQSDTNEKREIPELKADAELVEKRNEILRKLLAHLDDEVSETENQDQKLRIQTDDKQIIDNKKKQKSRRKGKRH